MCEVWCNFVCVCMWLTAQMWLTGFWLKCIAKVLVIHLIVHIKSYIVVCQSDLSPLLLSLPLPTSHQAPLPQPLLRLINRPPPSALRSPLPSSGCSPPTGCWWWWGPFSWLRSPAAPTSSRPSTSSASSSSSAHTRWAPRPACKVLYLVWVNCSL